MSKTSEDSDPPQAQVQPPIKVLVVDDDDSVHAVTTLLLRDFEFDGAPLALLHAYSAAEARVILQDEDSIAVVLLDVVMETVHAGLDLVEFIRRDLGNDLVRIILRTGQPGVAPEKDVILSYDINDYQEKVGLTATRLFTVVHTALRNYHSLQALAQSNQALEATTRQLEQFNYMVSHDVQAPLRNIRSLLLELNEDYGNELSPPVSGLLEKVDGLCGHAQQLVHDLILLARIGAEDMPRKPVNLNVVLQSVVDQLQEDIRQANAKVEWGGLPTVSGLSAYLSQLFQNLIGNAIKFNEDESPSVRISARELERSWVIEVRDDGIGMPKERTGSVLEPFVRLHPASRFVGTGIGLAICRKVVEMHGGKISIESEQEVGTTVAIELPKLELEG